MRKAADAGFTRNGLHVSLEGFNSAAQLFAALQTRQLHDLQQEHEALTSLMA